jgi:hypothetical protein
MSNFQIILATTEHYHYATQICTMIAESAKARGTGISKRKPEQIHQKMLEGKAVLALSGNILAGFCYFETWGNAEFVSNSGLIVNPVFRGKNLAKKIKEFAFGKAREKYPEAMLFGLTTSLPVMRINSDLGYKPTIFDKLTPDETFWKGCESCVNFDVLNRTEGKHCLCVGMIYDPEKENKLTTDINKNMN